LISLAGYCALLYFVLLRRATKGNPNQSPEPTRFARGSS
jgi:hypothetical protein